MPEPSETPKAAPGQGRGDHWRAGGTTGGAHLVLKLVSPSDGAGQRPQESHATAGDVAVRHPLWHSDWQQRLGSR